MGPIPLIDLLPFRSGNLSDESNGARERVLVHINIPASSFMVFQKAASVNQEVRLTQVSLDGEPVLQISFVSLQSRVSVHLPLPAAWFSSVKTSDVVSGSLLKDTDGRIIIDLTRFPLRLVVVDQSVRPPSDNWRYPSAMLPSQLAAVSQISSEDTAALLAMPNFPQSLSKGLHSSLLNLRNVVADGSQFFKPSVGQSELTALAPRPDPGRIASQIYQLVKTMPLHMIPLSSQSGSEGATNPISPLVAAVNRIGYSDSQIDGDRLIERFTQNVARARESVEGRKLMLIPDVSPAIPRPIAPDALPSQIPIRAAIAQELGLKVGQVVQALVATSGEKMGLQLGNRQLPMPPGIVLPEGPLTMRVVQTSQGLSFVPQIVNQAVAQSGQSVATGFSPALLTVLSKQGQRTQMQALLGPGQLEHSLNQLGLSSEAKHLSAQRLSSDRLTGDLIRQAMQFGVLGNEKAIAEGIAMQGGLMKPWLRQLLRLLPQQSELAGRLTGLLAEIEHLQLEPLSSNQVREGGVSALLVFRDQSPVELVFERHSLADEDGRCRKLWVINLHTEVMHLGEIWMKSSFEKQKVDLMFWAREASTAKLAKAGKYDLEEALSEHGLTVRSFKIFDQPRPDYHVLDEHASHMEVKA